MSYLRTIFMNSNNKSYRMILKIVLEKLCTLFTRMRSAPSIWHLLPLEWSHTKTFIQYSITVFFFLKQFQCNFLYHYKTKKQIQSVLNVIICHQCHLSHCHFSTHYLAVFCSISLYFGSIFDPSTSSKVHF